MLAGGCDGGVISATLLASRRGVEASLASLMEKYNQV